MSVYQRKETGAWYVKWRENGKQKTKNFGKDGEQEAKRFDEHQKRLKSNEAYSVPTLIELADYYLKDKGKILHEQTRKDIVRYIIKGCKDFNTTACDQITRRDLGTMRESLGNIKAATKNNAQAYINAIFNWGVENEYLARNPWDGAKRLKKQPFEFEASIDDIRAIMAHAAPHLKWAMEVSFNLALRPGAVELLSLKWSAFNWSTGCARFKQGKNVGMKKVELSSEFLEKAKARFVEDQKKGIQWVVHYRGRQIQSLKTAWNNAKRLAGYEHRNIRLYDIRHVAATELLHNGADPAAVQHQLGHKQLSTTMNIYGHLVAGAQKEAATMLPKLDEE